MSGGKVSGGKVSGGKVSGVKCRITPGPPVLSYHGR